MEVTIKIEDYLTPEEIKQIAIDHLRGVFADGGERVLSNLAYYAAEGIIDGCVTEDHKAMIKAKIPEVIEGMGIHTIFRKKDAWGSDDSVAYKELQKAMEECKPLINERVRAVILEHDFEKDLRTNQEYFVELMADMIRRGLSQ